MAGLVEKVAAAWPPERWKEVTVLVAVSGGADSVALSRALNQIKLQGEGQLILAHFNHGLRGAESDADQAFVQQLAAQLCVTTVVGAREGERGSGRGGEFEPGTSEESLRDVRYRFLAQAAGEYGARYVATAHTADDQVETVLHNLIRGTGLAGLAGIPRLRQFTEGVTLVRPLLTVARSGVLDYLQALGQSFRDDATNRSLTYTRNRIRHELLPLLEREYNPHVRAAIGRLSQITSEADSLLEQQAEALLCLAARQTEGGVEIDVDAISDAHPALIRQALLILWRRQDWPLQDMSFEKWEQLLSITKYSTSAHSAPIRQQFPGNVCAEREGGALRLSRHTSS